MRCVGEILHSPSLICLPAPAHMKHMILYKSILSIIPPPESLLFRALRELLPLQIHFCLEDSYLQHCDAPRGLKSSYIYKPKLFPSSNLAITTFRLISACAQGPVMIVARTCTSSPQQYLGHLMLKGKSVHILVYFNIALPSRISTVRGVFPQSSVHNHSFGFKVFVRYTEF